MTLVILDLMDSQELVKLDFLDNLEHQVQTDCLVLMVNQAYLVIQDQLVSLDGMDSQALPAAQVTLVSQVHRVELEPLELLECKDQVLEVR